MTFCEPEGILSHSDCDVFMEIAQDALLEATDRQRDIVEQANPVRLFWMYLASCCRPAMSDWVVRRGPCVAGVARHNRLAKFSGNPSARQGAFGAVAKALRDRGELCSVPEDALWRRMRDAKLLIPVQTERTPSASLAISVVGSRCCEETPWTTSSSPPPQLSITPTRPFKAPIAGADPRRPFMTKTPKTHIQIESAPKAPTLRVSIIRRLAKRASQSLPLLLFLQNPPPCLQNRGL